MPDREPCPWRIVDDVGGAYCMGAIGGGLFHAIKGSWNSPRGGKLMGSMTNMQARGPVLGGQFAVWGGLFACCDCSLTAIRQKVSIKYYSWHFSVSTPKQCFFVMKTLMTDPFII